MPLVIVLVAAVVLVFYIITLRNSLVATREQVDRAWANIDVVLKQRFDEIPQIVSVVEQFARYEKSIVDKVVASRQRYGAAHTIDEKIASSAALSGALRGLLAIVENYPELKANQNFLQLQSRVSQLEGTIADRREGYNDSVTLYNTRINQFPDSIFAQNLSMRRRPLFQVAEAEKALPNLKMDLGA